MWNWKVEVLLTSDLCHYVPCQIWSKNIKAKSIDLTALKKHGKVYGDGKRSVKPFIFYIFKMSFSADPQKQIYRRYIHLSVPPLL